MKKAYSSRKILQMLHEDGWVEKGQEGSHVQLVHPTKPGKVTVKYPVKDLNLKTVESIFRQAGLKIK